MSDMYKTGLFNSTRARSGLTGGGEASLDQLQLGVDAN